MNIPTPNHLREQEEHDIECDKYKDDIIQQTIKYISDPVSFIHDNVMDFEPWDNKGNFNKAFETRDFYELGRGLFFQIISMAEQQATEDVETN